MALPKYQIPNTKYGRGFTTTQFLLTLALISSLFLATRVGSTLLSYYRDLRRQNDLKEIAQVLEVYRQAFNRYPKGKDNGYIYGCYPDGNSLCIWGKTWRDHTRKTLMDKVPEDPIATEYTYYYWATPTGDRYQLYAYLESPQGKGVFLDANDRRLYYSGTFCGQTMCNYGIASKNITPETARSLVTKEGKIHLY